MASGLKFRIFGIPVHVDNSFWVIAALLGFTGGTLDIIVSWVVVVFVSVLLHELGHAVAFRIYGQRPRVQLLAMGGLTSGSAPLTGSRDIVVSLAGPLTGLLLLGVPALLLPDHGGNSITEIVRRELLFVNIAWSVVNLLPVLPLDGGQVAASVLRRFRGEKGQLLAYKLSMVTAAAAALFAYQQQYVFGAFFAVFFIAQNYGSLRQERLAHQRQPLVAGYQALIGNDLDGAVSAADDVLATSPAPVPEVAASAVELKAWARLCGGDVDAASATLDDMPRGVTTNGFLTGSLALEAGRTGEALDAFAEAFGRTRSGPGSPSGALSGVPGVIVAETVARSGLVGDLTDRLLATPPGPSGPQSGVPGPSGPRRGVPGPSGPQSGVTAAGVDALVRLQSHLHAAGRFPEAAAVGQRAFDADPDKPAHVAYDVACSWARAGKADDALHWLERAADAGLSEPALADDDPDLAPIRSTPRYRAVVARMGGARDDGVPPAPAR